MTVVLPEPVSIHNCTCASCLQWDGKRDEALAKVLAAVDEGVRLLDQVRPGWYDEINTETLDIASAYRCVLGQLYGDFVAGVEALNIPSGGETYGFNAPYFIDFTPINDKWKGIIHDRLTSKTGQKD